MRTRENALFLSFQADTCIPKLNEGDQIVLINGRDISEHTHDQVVMFIKASRESHTRELALVIRRKGNCRLRGRCHGDAALTKGDLLRPFRGSANVTLAANIRKSRTFINNLTCDFSLKKCEDLPMWGLAPHAQSSGGRQHPAPPL